MIAAEPKSTVRLVEPFPEIGLPFVESWLEDGPADCYLSDVNPDACKRFVEGNGLWWRTGRRIWGMVEDGETVGAIGFEHVTLRYGFLRGPYCSRASWEDCAPGAVYLAIKHLFDSGVEKFHVSFFADDSRRRRLFTNLGATHEGFLRRQAMRAGVLADVELMAFFKGGL